MASPTASPFSTSTFMYFCHMKHTYIYAPKSTTMRTVITAFFLLMRELIRAMSQPARAETAITINGSSRAVSIRITAPERLIPLVYMNTAAPGMRTMSSITRFSPRRDTILDMSMSRGFKGMARSISLSFASNI